MLGLLEGIRGGASDARAAEQLQLQREQALRQQQMQDMQIQQMRRAMERENRTQADIDAAIAAWGDEGAAPPVGLAPPRNVNAPVGLEPPEPMATPAGAAPGMPGAAPTGGLSKFDRAVGTAALRSGNFDAAYKLKDRAKAESQDAGRKAEFKRLMEMPGEEMEKLFSSVNANGNVPIMVKYDPQSKKMLLTSDHPLVKSGALSRAQMAETLLSVWELGNGDFKRGMEGFMAAASRQEARGESAFNKSLGLARLDMDAAFKNADDVRQGRQVDAQIAHWKAMEAAAGGRGGKTVSPETLTKMRDLEQKWTEADPKDRPAIERQYQILESQASFEVGRPRGLPSKSPEATMPLEKALELVQGMPAPAQFNPSGNKKLTVAQLPMDQQIAIAESVRRGAPAAVSGGLPASVKPEPRTPGLQPPRGATPPGGAPVAGLDVREDVRAEAVSSGAPVMLNIGGRSMMVDPQGNLREAPAAASAGPAGRGVRTQDPVSEAEMELNAAKQQLQRYGLRQRSQDPGGFRQAELRLQQARENYNRVFDATVQRPTGAAFRYAAP